MLNVLIDGVVLVVVFAAGAAVGIRNVPTVDKAIAALKGYEADALSTLAQITAHKATAPATTVTTTVTPAA